MKARKVIIVFFVLNVSLAAEGIGDFWEDGGMKEACFKSDFPVADRQWALSDPSNAVKFPTMKIQVKEAGHQHSEP